MSKSGIYHVNLGTNASEMAWFSDVVLPTNHSTFESLNFANNQRGRGHNVYPLTNICVDPKLWDTKEAETEFVWLLGKKLAATDVSSVVTGWPAGYKFTKLSDYVDTLVAAADSAAFHTAAVKKLLVNNDAALWTKITSTTPADYEETGTYDITAGKAIGYGIRQATYASTYFDAVTGAGDAWDGGNFNTVSTKVEFSAGTGGARASSLVTAFNSHKTAHALTSYKPIIEACNYDLTASSMTTTDSDAANDIAFMPHWEDPKIAGDVGEYPFIFVDAKSRLNREGRTGNCQWYYEFKQCDAGDARWKDVIKINPADGLLYGIPDGAKVKVTSPSNTTGIICRVKHWEGVRSGVAVKTYGQGHWAYGRLAAGRTTLTGAARAETGNNNELLPHDPERIACGNARNASTRVKIQVTT
jgi:hypothetical protein